MPLLHTFVTGANTENRVRRYGEATNAVQNLSEQVQALDADSIFLNSQTIATGATFYTKIGLAYTAAGTTVSAPTSEIYYIGIPNYTYGSSSYDALITLDSSGGVNTDPVVVGNHMDALLNMAQADVNALAALQFQCNSSAASGYTLVSNNLERSITFNVPELTNSLDPYSIYVKFEYSADVTYTDKDSNTHTLTFTDTEQSSASVGSVVVPADGSPIFSVFLFFDAYYSSDMINEDITINNDTGSDINFFLVNTSTASIPGTYGKAQIAYKNQNFTDTRPVNNLVFTNLPTNNVAYTAWKDAYVSKSDVDVTGYLVETESRNRKFNVNIQLFEGGSGFTGTAIAEINSTKLSY